jgi:phosphatidylglycerophosphate synthase
MAPFTVGGALHRSGGDLGAAALPLLAVTATTWRLFGLPASYLIQVVAVYTAMSALVVWHAPAFSTTRGLGIANRITLGRATLVLPVAALVFHPQSLLGAAYWWVILCSAAAMLLDSLDGSVARRTGTTSAFGAGFDMELDAFLVLVLAVLVWQSGKVGPWVLVIGALRYLFVAAGWMWPGLRGQLPESQRRKAVCVVQGIVLLACLPPMMPSVMASAVAAGGLALLMYSFVADVTWLATH